MRRRLLKDFLLPMSLPMVASFFACIAMSCSEDRGGNDVAGGPGSITTNGIVACVGDAPVPNARVSLRSLDYQSPDAAEEVLIVGSADVLTDSAGYFDVEVPEEGDFRLTVAHDGMAYSRIVSSKTYAGMDSVKLEATATVTGVADIPEGSKSIWVGVMGTDVLVRSDSNGVFVIPALPANDSMLLYIMDEDYGKELQRKPVYLAPYEQVLYNYKAPVKIDSVVTETPVEEDSVEVPVDTVPRVTVLMPDGSPAAYATVALRSSDATVKRQYVRNPMIVADLHADESGQFTMTWPESGEFRLTVTLGNLSYSGIYAAEGLSEIDTLELASSIKFASVVTLRAGEEFAWVGVRGLDVFVKTDGDGAYVLPALPAEDSLDIYFVYKDGTAPFMDWNVRTSKESKDIRPSVMLNDFEGESEGWYLSIDTLGQNSTFFGTNGKPEENPQVADRVYEAGRDSKSFNGYYRVAFDPYAWVLLGTQLKEDLNMASLDSIEFFAKGNGRLRVALENWENYESSSKASSDWLGLDSVWTRFVITPSELCWNSQEVKDCDNTWNEVKGQVKQIHFFPAGGNEFHVDDIKLYGVLF